MANPPEKQPWNPYPLASLSAGRAFDLSSCATIVLIYLAARSDFQGKTWVGQERIREDLGRSKDYVTRAVRELKEKGMIETKQRSRHARQADLTIISARILAKSDPDRQDQIAGSDLEINPASQDQSPMSDPDFPMSDPDRGGETLHYNLTGNLEPNLADGQSVSQSASLAPLATGADAPSLEAKKEPLEDVLCWQDPDKAAAWLREGHAVPGVYELLSEGMHKPFGLPYVPQGHEQAIAIITCVSPFWSKSEDAATVAAWAIGLASWARTVSKFWKGRVFSLEHLAESMNRDNGKGICSQYNTHVKARHDRAVAGR